MLQGLAGVRIEPAPVSRTQDRGDVRSGRIRRAGIAVIMIHPGAVKTERTPNAGNPVAVELPFSVAQMIGTIDAVTLKDSGRFMLYDGSTLPW